MTPIPARPCVFAAVLSAALLAGCQGAYFWALNARVPVQEVQTRVYDSDHHLSLDAYRGQSAGPAPVVVFIYGGSWQNGERGYYRFVAAAFAREGIATVIPDYRKSPAVAFPAFIDDSARAIAWTRAHATEFGGDPARIYVMGHSAGAHIAALLGTDGSYLARVGMTPRQLSGVIGLAGPYDFLPITDPKIKKVFGAEKDWPASQPVNFVDGDEPPFLLLHGAADKTVWPRNSERLAAKLRAAGESVTLEIIPGVSHVGLVDGFVSAKYSPVLAESLRWIKATPASSAGSR